MVHNMHRDSEYNGYSRLHVQLHAEGKPDNSHCRYGSGCKQDEEFDNAGTEIRMEQVSSERRPRQFLLGIYSDRIARWVKFKKK